MTSESRARLRLALSVESGDPRLAALLQQCSPEEVCDRLEGGDPRLPEVWRKRDRQAARVDEVLERSERTVMRWIVPGDEEWPSPIDDLDEIDPGPAKAAGRPLGLWVRGRARLNDLTASALAVVGARECTSYGAEVASDLAADCGDAGMTIVSGAAFGIDVCAHRGARLAAAPTIAVLACGADVDYPRAHGALLSRIAEEDGLVVSEQPPGEPPQRQRFLSRNRIIAALSDGVVVVEAARRSGALNTLRWADQLSRTCMLVPGPVTSQQSVGCHRALRCGQGVLVTSASEVLNELYGLDLDNPASAFPLVARRIWQVLGTRPASVTELSVAAHMTPREVVRGAELLRRDGLAAKDAGLWRRKV